jgi:hypothetical protein
MTYHLHLILSEYLKTKTLTKSYGSDKQLTHYSTQNNNLATLVCCPIAPLQMLNGEYVFQHNS